MSGDTMPVIPEKNAVFLGRFQGSRASLCYYISAFIIHGSQEGNRDKEPSIQRTKEEKENRTNLHLS